SIHIYLIFFLQIPPQPNSTLFPYTTLFRSRRDIRAPESRSRALKAASYSFVNRGSEQRVHVSWQQLSSRTSRGHKKGPSPAPPLDRKSTRLNSSHVAISYAVFCLKKKTRTA